MNGRKTPRHSLAVKDRVMADYRAGMALKQIAAKHDVSLSFASQLAVDWGGMARRYGQKGKPL